MISVFFRLRSTVFCDMTVDSFCNVLTVGYDPAINVLKYEVDRFKTVVYRVERLYHQTHSL